MTVSERREVERMLMTQQQRQSQVPTPRRNPFA